MLRGLEGRRIGLFSGGGAAATEIRKELIAEGAEVTELPGSGDDLWQGARYAGLVLVGPADEAAAAGDRVRQLVREMLVSDKPVAVFDVDGASFGADPGMLAAEGKGDARAFAARIVESFADRLEEGAVDEMSELSFPASDPPATNPGVAGPVSPDPRPDARA